MYCHIYLLVYVHVVVEEGCHCLKSSPSLPSSLLYSLTHSLHVLVKVAYCHNKVHVFNLMASTEDPEMRRLAKLHALSWLHGLAGLQQLGGLPLVKPTMEGLKRMLAKPTVRKEPVMANILKGHWTRATFV